MDDSPGSDISPRTQGTLSISPQTALDGTKGHRALSSLRMGQSTDNAPNNSGSHRQMLSVPNGNTIQPITKPLLGSLDGVDNEPNEFPFTAPSGRSGSHATIDTINAPLAQGPSSMRSDSNAASRKPVNDDDSAAPARRSVQFARTTTFDTGGAHSRNQSNQSTEAEECEGKGKEKEKQGSSLMTKLKALAAPISMQGHGRSLSAFAGGPPATEEGGWTPSAMYAPPEVRYGEGDSEADADAEESAGEGPSRPPRRRRKTRRMMNEGSQTAPTTPKNSKPVSFFSRDSPGGTPTSTRPSFLRRATMSDIPENQRQGVSEDEGRDRLAKESAWTRGLHSARGLSYGGFRKHEPDGSEERRPSNLRRLTGFGSGAEGAPSPWRMRSERTGSLSAQKWAKIKAGLKMLGQRSKAERQVDHAKSAELMAELLAGAPAALFLASMFQRDEHGHKRTPILLEQLKVTVVDTAEKAGERHAVFRIELEYGSGLTRMKWVIHRSVRDFANLHLKYKLQEQTDRYIRLGPEDSKRPKLPRFPRSALPYLRGLRGYGALEDEEEEDIAAGGEPSGPDGEGSGTDRPGRGKRRRSSFRLGRRKSSISSPAGLTTPGTPGDLPRTGSFAGGLLAGPVNSRQSHSERQRKKLEHYLTQLITYLIFRPDSNRLCKFLELSALGVRLAAEGGYHGKEGFMMIQSGKGIDFRKKWAPSLMIKRHTPKWFLVRHSYVCCVDSPEEMNIYDVILVDSDFKIDSSKQRLRDKNAKEIASEAKTSAAHPNHHLLRLVNSERRTKLLAKNERQLQQFEDSIRFMMANTQWSKINRFGSFAPVRKKIYAQWLVDGRDYMWNVSRAISMARDVIYIHDWWLSPELYMRRPAAISQKWRLDRLLQRKAQEGVKIFVIMYRNINTAIPIDSEYSKFSLLDLHPNIFVQRSPNQIRQNTFFWAHHEKICVVDHTIAFCGGVDLCFGRWDTPKHSVVDDKLTGFELNDVPKDADHCQLWPGKDYSNPRVQDFFNLDKPYEEMYDRTKVPRMPWHDIGMQVVGQPARDLTRHFTQRWNYLLRQRKPSRPTPFLLPPPDFNPADIEALGLDGTCEVQMLRSACAWSIGTPGKTEHSIQTAYVQMITTSEHFVYIENQFFITSCEVEGTKIENKIGDALVDRIKRAHKNEEDWRACIVIPLMPGFQNTVDSQDGSSVRLIMTCQYRSICRGETSIFARLRDAGIEPEDYIQFYALRSWGAIGPAKTLVTEQLYIHAKCMIVDDRVAIIGSANINERSMMGDRDSEVACIVRDTEMIDSYMAGEPYKVGRFPHTLRVRLMREHLGLDTDELFEEECQSQQSDAGTEFHTESSTPSSPTADHITAQRLTENKLRMEDDLIAKAERLHSFNHDVDWEQEGNPHVVADKKVSSDPRVMNNMNHEKDVRGEGPDRMLELEHERPSLSRGRDSYINPSGKEVLLTGVATEAHLSTLKKSSHTTRARSNTTTTKASEPHSIPDGYAGLPPPKIPRMDTTELGLLHLSQLPSLPPADDTDIGGPPLQRTFSKTSSHIISPLLADMRRPVVNPDCMRDPLNDAAYLDIWHTVAENNTKIFRQVFRCMPDNEVKTWREYKEYAAFAERFQQAQGGGKSSQRRQQENPGKTGPPGTGVSDRILSPTGDADRKTHALGEKLMEKLSLDSTDHSNTGMGKVEQWADDQEKKDSISAAERVNSPTTDLDEKAALRAEDSSPPTTSGTGTTPVPPIPNTTATEDFGNSTNSNLGRQRTVTYSEPPLGRTRAGTVNGTIGTGGSQKRRRRATTKSSTKAFHANDEGSLLDREDAEELLKLVQGHLVIWPYDWLKKEEETGGWLYAVDQIAPLEIYD
ncbi:phospholipase D [Delitschia confertaspora ATCC 74209]|uniref:Phospholipase D1 n=1 Tax=Delitschia confertaspora ATCC 74209 TaxID=1513339 RepID=A0A9P4JMQ8_9PLEO|nr:phospholipase D [Delitschia confertaspora ATCC 74209]